MHESFIKIMMYQNMNKNISKLGQNYLILTHASKYRGNDSQDTDRVMETDRETDRHKVKETEIEMKRER